MQCITHSLTAKRTFSQLKLHVTAGNRRHLPLTMRPPWGELAFAMSLVSLVLLIAGFNWNAWLTAKGKDESSSSMAYDLQAGRKFISRSFE